MYQNSINSKTNILLYRWDLLGAKVYSQECTRTNECGRVEGKSIMVMRVLLDMCVHVYVSVCQ
jgi:hypothetical protein